jgi:tetratricopeptide (TPR) repeat protein
MPTSVQAIIAARLDALPTEERRVLQDASVIGRTFWRGPLAAISGNGARLDTRLDSLESRDFIRRHSTSTVAGDREFTFKHLLTREVAYGTLPRAARRQRHASIANYLERVTGDRVRESASVLAHHWKEAGDHSRAARYLVMAAEVASRAWAKQQAVNLYSDAIALLRGLGDDERVVEARLGRAATLIDAAQYASAVETDLDWLLDVTTGRNLCLAHLARARAAFWLADAAGVRGSSQAAVKLARELGDVELEGRALVALHEAVAMAGDTEGGKKVFAQALEKWPGETRDSAFARGFGTRATMAYWTGDYEECLRMGTEGHEMGIELSNVEAAMIGAKNVGLALAGLTRHEEAFKWFERAIDLGREWEQDRFTSRGMNMWSGALREVGDLARARELSQEAIELGTRASFPGAVVSARIDLLFADLASGKVGDAEAAVPGLLEAVEKTKGWHEWLWSIRVTEARAETALASGRYEEAAALARQAIEEALGPHRVKYACLARTVSGRALLALGRAEEAAGVLSHAVEEAERLGHAPSLWPALAGLAEALERLGREEEAAEALHHADTSIEHMAGRLTEDRQHILRARPDVAAILDAASVR